jgi:hypothetical protein
MTTANILSQLGSPGVSTGFKNRIINGAMTFDQRNAGASVTPSLNGTYTLDRWATYFTQASKFSVQQNAGSITPPVGFSNYLGCTSSSAYSVLAGDTFVVAQVIEGFNLADLGFGTANAKTITLSFQVYSSLTGTFGGSLTNGAANRSYLFSYSIPTANTWTQISVTIAGDTSGTWLTNNGIGLYVRFGLGSGATFSGTAGSWGAGNLVQPTGTVSVVGTSGATWYITGVQLEVGTTATNFEYRPYGTELQLCQRYYEKSYEIGVVPGTPGSAGNWAGVGGQNYPRTVTEFKVDKRTPPTVVFYADSDGTTGNVNIWNAGTVLKVAAANIFVTSKLIGPEGDTASVLSTRAAMYYHWTASSEL